jgi:hypothetical protein
LSGDDEVEFLGFEANYIYSLSFSVLETQNSEVFLVRTCGEFRETPYHILV